MSSPRFASSCKKSCSSKRGPSRPDALPGRHSFFTRSTCFKLKIVCICCIFHTYKRLATSCNIHNSITTGYVTGRWAAAACSAVLPGRLCFLRAFAPLTKARTSYTPNNRGGKCSPLRPGSQKPAPPAQRVFLLLMLLMLHQLEGRY